jgi:hypothetical protein
MQASRAHNRCHDRGISRCQSCMARVSYSSAQPPDTHDDANATVATIVLLYHAHCALLSEGHALW